MRTFVFLGIICSMLFGCQSVKAQGVDNILSDLSTKIGSKSIDAPINDAKLVTVDMVKGAWVYDSPLVLYKSKKLLGKVTELITGTMETKLNSELGELFSKYNIYKDSVSLEFGDSSRLACAVKTDTIQAKYLLSGKIVQFSIGEQNINANINVNDSVMQLTFTADRLFAFVRSINTKEIKDMKMSAISALAGLKENVQLGMTLRRK